MKRAREEENVDGAKDEAKEQRLESGDAAEAPPSAPAPPVDEEDDDDQPQAPRRGALEIRKGHECPYIDTISRQNLDFDFEKCCSVSLSPVNVYACLVCGKYFQGRGRTTHAYTHCLEAGHHMFMKLDPGADEGSVWCLPEGYRVDDRSLDDVRAVLNPKFTKREIATLDTSIRWSRALDGTEYMPGLVGLNNMRANDYANAVVQILARVAPIRDFFLDPGNYSGCRSLLVQRTGELLRKAWHPRNFKGHVSPHEFMQAVKAASGKTHLIEKQSDVVQFMTWLMNTLHSHLTDGKVKRPSVITAAFQGELEVWTEAGTGGNREVDTDTGLPRDKVERVPFLMLALDLPPAPLFKDNLERLVIAQVPIHSLLKKYNGQTVSDDVRAGRRKFRIARLPDYLTLHIRRFTKNNFFWEKNPSIVNFPVKGLDVKDLLLSPPTGPSPLYDLCASVTHEGKTLEGAYKAYVHRRVEDTWFEVQDLSVQEVLPQMVALSETYLQVYERRREKA